MKCKICHNHIDLIDWISNDGFCDYCFLQIVRYEREPPYNLEHTGHTKMTKREIIHAKYVWGDYHDTTKKGGQT
jgi:hypothetical protein